MRVLWLTQTPAGASNLLQFTLPGCGWISSLQEYIKAEKNIELGIAFFQKSNQFKFTHERVVYYPLRPKYASFSGKLYQRLTSALYDSNLEDLKKAINDFQPDIIHLFGTETGLGEIIEHTSIPVVIHLQGLAGPYTYAWHPKGVSKWHVLLNSPLRSIIYRTGFFFEYKLFQKRSAREEKIVEKGTYFFGRTHWDKNFVSLYNRAPKYIHCEEMLRPSFYKKKWCNPTTDILKLVTLINPYLYKGIEIILEAAHILKEKSHLKFIWQVIGIDNDSDLVKLIEKLQRKKFTDYNIIFKGAAEEETVVELLLSSNLFVHPSHIDNSPNSVCEAMLLGIPIIASNVGGISSLIDDKESGVLYNSHDPYELAGHIMKFSRNPEIWSEYREKARNIALKKHDRQRIVKTVMNSYYEIINNNLNSRIEKVFSEENSPMTNTTHS